MKPKSSYITVTDQFCGAGGSSLGAASAGTEIVMALNHWKLAVETHNTNFPDTLHDCTDISATDPRRYPATDILITSPECTNHSLAKGRKRKNQGQLSLFGENKLDPAEERSRATMWDVPRFAEFHNYNVVIVENVVDARHWVMFDAWIHAMRSLGYSHEIVYYNSMFAHPTPQSRDRMYVVFWKKGNKKPDLRIRPKAWCGKCERDVEGVQSWKNLDRKWGRYGPRNQYVYVCPTCAGEVLPYYYAAANAIDWSIPGKRIGDREKPLKPRTMERIAYGLKKYGRTFFTVHQDNSSQMRVRSVEEALFTQTTRQVVGLVMPLICANQGDKHVVRTVLDPMYTQVASVQPTVIIPQPFLMSYYTRENASSELDEAMPTVTSENRHGLVIPPLLVSLNRSDNRVRSAGEPLPTVMPHERPSLVVPPYIIEFYGQGTARSLEEALSTVMTVPHHGLITPFIASYYGTENAAPIDDPLHTVTTADRHALVQPESLSVEDCFFRMLQPHEIGRAMAFPDTYVVLGSSREKVKQYGNAVTPPVLKLLVERCVESLQ